MISFLFYLSLTGLLAFFISKHRKTGEAKHLQSASSIVFVITFCAAFEAAVQAVLFPSRQWLIFALLLGGCLTGGLMLARTYEGWRKIFAAAQTFAFLLVVSFMASSMAYFRKVIVHSHAASAATSAVPGSAISDIRAMDDPRKAALALKLADALSNGDRFVRIGALTKLRYLGQAAAPAVPALIQLIGTSDPDTAENLLELLKELGPAAKEAGPALSARLADAKDYPDHRLEAALKAVSVSSSPGR